MACTDKVCRGSVIDQNLVASTNVDQNNLLTKAEIFLRSFYDENQRYLI